MALVIIANEKTVRDTVFANYKNVAAFTLSKGLSGVTVADRQIDYEKLNFMPDDDTINAIKAGDMKIEKVIRNAAKIICHPSMERDDAIIGLGVTQLIAMLTPARRHGKNKGELVVAFIKDDSDPERSKILTKFLKGILGVFGIKPLTNVDKIKKMFKKKKKAVDRVFAYVKNDDNHCTLSSKGGIIKKRNMLFYELELRQAEIDVMDVDDIGKGQIRGCVKTLTDMYTGENLLHVKKKMGKRLKDKNEAAVDAYKSFKEIMKLVDRKFKLHKVKYGQKKNKRKEPVGPRMNVKKFQKFFDKKKNRALIVPLYAHTLAIMLGLDVGTKQYNSHMKNVCSIFGEEFSKQYIAAVNAYVKPATK